MPSSPVPQAARQVEAVQARAVRAQVDAHGSQALPLQGVSQAMVCCQGLDLGAWPQLAHKSGRVPYVGRLQQEDAFALSRARQDAAGRLQAQHCASRQRVLGHSATLAKPWLDASCIVLHPEPSTQPLHPPTSCIPARLHSLSEGEPGLQLTGTLSRR